MIAVGEVAANTVRHARSAGSMEIWLDGGELVCEIRDAGVITDPLVGRQPPPPEANGGHGLWLVHQICDRVELHSDENGDRHPAAHVAAIGRGGRGREPAARPRDVALARTPLTRN